MVAVYDTGEQDARPFIVMEYVAGRSLREVLRREGVLPQRAAEIASSAALGLHYAHERGLIHRDVKPANIMISNEGQVKVTDFGIARAMNAETVTQTAAVFGTAAYIAPEQAQGLPVDARTDVYSLGVVLYEMLTGRQPFSADSAVALAYKHVSEDPPRPTQLNPEIPASLEAVVLRAMAKNPDNRYQSARAFHEDIERALRGERVSAPSVLAYAPTQAIPTAERTTALPVTERVPAEEYYEEDGRRGNRGLGYAALIVLLLLFFALAAYLLVRLFATDPPTLVEVPNVIGDKVTVAQERLQKAGFDTDVKRVNDDSAEPNTVLATDPQPRERVEEGTLVVLEVSKGPKLIQVPKLEGMTESEAFRVIQDAELSVGNRTAERSDEFEKGRVISSTPEAGSEVEKGTPIDIVVSDGPATVVIPDVSNMREQEARQTLNNACDTPPCLDVTVEYREDAEEEGEVINTSPRPATRVPFGSSVILRVSQGQPEPPPSSPPPSPSPSPSPTEEPSDGLIP
jgi:serine/threonine-protein kinase